MSSGVINVKDSFLSSSKFIYALTTGNPHRTPTPGRRGAYVGICKCLDDLPAAREWGHSSLETIYILDGNNSRGLEFSQKHMNGGS